MATVGNNLSKEETFPISNPEKLKIGIVISDWNSHITERLLKGAVSVLNNSGIPAENIIIKMFLGHLNYH